MEAKNIINLFNDDFVDLFAETDMDIDDVENSLQAMSTLIKLLETESSPQKRLETIQNLALKYVPVFSISDIDRKLFQHLMPAVKVLFDDIFKEICLVTSTVQQKSNETLTTLQNYLQMCIDLHETLGLILEYVLQNNAIELCRIETIPGNISYTLLLTFQHCKESDKIYKSYFDELKEIPLLFKAAQEVHTKLLKLLERHINFNLPEDQISVITNVLELLAEMGEVLIDMNIKMLADNWKGYMTLTQKLAGILNRISFNIAKPIMFLSHEITRNLNNVLEIGVDQNETKMDQTLKASKFFVRVALKLFETFWPSLERISVNVVEFLSTIYDYYPPFMRSKKHSNEVVDQINVLIFGCFDTFLDKLLCEPAFFMGCTKTAMRKMNVPGCLYMCTFFLQKLSVVDGYRLSSCDIYSFIDLFFDAVGESYCELFRDLAVWETGKKQSIYDVNLINTVKIVESLNAKQYSQIEIILLKNVLQNCNIWNALLATDVWCLLLRKKPKLCYETLCLILTKRESISPNNYINRPEDVFLDNILQKLYSFLPENYRSDIVENFPLSSNLHIWKVIGFDCFPKDKFFVVESFLINIVEKLELLRQGKCDAVSFNFLCDGFDVISSLPTKNEINLNYLLSVLVKMWNFELDSQLCDNTSFKVFLEKLCRVTANFVPNFNNEQLLLILTKLKQSQTTFNIKIHTTNLLKSLSARSFKHSSEQNQVITVTSELFRLLLTDENAIVKENTLEIFIDFVNNTPHDEIAQNVVGSDVVLQRAVSNYIHKNVDDASLNLDEYFAKQKTYEFRHKQKPDVSYFKQKRLKTDDGDEISLIMKRISNDVHLVHKLRGKENRFEKNLAEIVNILNR